MPSALFSSGPAGVFAVQQKTVAVMHKAVFQHLPPGGGAAGALLLGPLGVVAAATAKTKGVHVVAVQFKDGKRSLLELDDTRFKAIKLAMF